MHIPTEIHCQACQYVTSHPVDACPVCGAQFYWLVVPREALGKATVEEFIAKMERLVEGNITPEFLNHGGRLWLPYSFWNYNPNGDAILEFSWISEIRCLQHGTSAKTTKEAKQTDANPKEGFSPWDTQPSLPTEMMRKVRNGKNPRFKGGAPHRRGSQDAETTRGPAAAPRPLEPESPERRQGVFPRELFAPVMILIFFLMLALSFLVLRYHKNRQALLRIPTKDVTHERSVLP